MHDKCTTNAQQMHEKCTTNARQTHEKCTTNARQTHEKCTTNARKMHNKCTLTNGSKNAQVWRMQESKFIVITINYGISTISDCSHLQYE